LLRAGYDDLNFNFCAVDSFWNSFI